MRRILLAATAFTAMGFGSAFAADLPSRAPVAFAPPPVFTWTGFYVGVNGGYAGDKYRYNLNGVPGLSASASINSSGFVGGGQIGYNFQFSGPFVLGLEADIQASGLKGELALAATLGNNGLSANAGSKTDYFGTVRGRLGYAGIERLLVYVTGGYAYGNTKSYYSIVTPGPVLAGSTSSTRSGWTVGGGMEYAILPHWSIKAEYLYVDLGKKNLASFGPASISEKTKFNVVRAGINYRF
jgi:outer membrane immunogenic protein